MPSGDEYIQPRASGIKKNKKLRSKTSAASDDVTPDNIGVEADAPCAERRRAGLLQTVGKVTPLREREAKELRTSRTHRAGKRREHATGIIRHIQYRLYSISHIEQQRQTSSRREKERETGV